jgi:hypothetical protein
VNRTLSTIRGVTLALAILVASLDRECSAAPEVSDQFVRWWDRLGYPDTSRLRFGFVRTTAGRSAGFLLWEDGASFSVFKPSLRIDRYAPPTSRDESLTRASFEPADMETYGASLLSSFGSPEEPKATDRETLVRAAVIARTCLGTRRDELGRRILGGAVASGMRGASEGFIPLQKAVGETAWNLLQAEFGYPRSSWADLLAYHRRWQQNFGELGLEDVATSIRTLEAMVRAGSTDPAACRGFDGQRRGECYVRALQEADRPGPPWTPEFFGSSEPVRELKKLGLRAVPALIGALNDRRFTRATFRVGWDEGDADPYLVLRVYQFVGEILKDLSSGELRNDMTEADVRRWYERASASSTPPGGR